ncbi:DUF1059 domain-containing protein [Saccharopolyspora rhizosphaerae]|uniref:DUF1059 domain-containing protein n=1 Tax=Saccharopolyspora rhizosphaerae TaxID=2492662 RepID=A0A426K1A5_9PSEU|nr:DUF1059 domain-containing protein [Saccharopolyspora rhizosphaerae]RRO19225.1 DUF1059 domain-containing protein [Saccharopolyspora rhizosphaerae]
MTRKVADCRRTPSESGCSLTIAGEEDEVVRAAVEHAVSTHGHSDTPELREQIRAVLEDEVEPGSASLRFVQLIEFRTRRADELNKLVEEWESRAGGKRAATRALLTHSHEQPDVYYEFIEFPSYDEAVDAHMPEADELSQRIRDLCEGEPTFHTLDVVRPHEL